MRIGIMQPYFMPWIGYFSLIKHVDMFILLDTVQFKKHSFMQRNRILSSKEGWTYISIPVRKCRRETNICDIKARDEPWREKIIAQLVHYKKSPYYQRTIELVREALDSDSDELVEIDRKCLNVFCRFMGIETPIQVYSEMGLHISSVDAPDEWALRICEAIPGVTEYWNPPGGMDFFDRSKYGKSGIDIKFQFMNLHKYNQGNRRCFEEALSIIDVLMFNSKEEICEMLNDFALK